MTFKITFLEIAREDIGDAIRWYELQQKGLGEKFFAAIEEAVEIIRKTPKAFPEKYQGLRVKLIKGFPYALFYKVVNQHVEVYACLHLSRNISNILKNR